MMPLTSVKKILVVDDEPLILRVATSRLKASGYEVITATDGEEAFEKASSEIPDLIVLDVMLPKMDGHKVCRLLKQEEKYRHIPILMFSARVQADDQEKGMAAGADAYMAKPFDPQKFLAKIQELLTKKKDS